MASLGFRVALWLWCAGPAAQLAFYTATDQLGANPQEFLLRALGLQVLMLLLLILALPVLARPAATKPWLQPLLQSRRMLGLWAFTYGAVHFLAFWQFDHGLLLDRLWEDTLRRPFVSVGLAALLLMLPLALTSNRFSLRRLGPRWKALHSLAWPAAWLGLLHYALHKAGKNDFAAPLLALAILLAVIAARRALGPPGRRSLPARPPAG